MFKELYQLARKVGFSSNWDLIIFKDVENGTEVFRSSDDKVIEETKIIVNKHFEILQEVEAAAIDDEGNLFPAKDSWDGYYNNAPDDLIF